MKKMCVMSVRPIARVLIVAIIASTLMISMWVLPSGNNLSQRRALMRVAPRQRDVAQQLSNLHADFEISASGEIESVSFVWDVDANDPMVRDEDIKCIRDIDSLRELSLLRTFVTSEGLKIVGSLPNLRRLATFVYSDDDLESVMTCRHLEALSLSGDYSCEGLKRIAGLTGIKELILCGTSLKADGITALNAMSALRELQIIQQPITDEMVHDLLPTLAKLDRLSLISTKVTDRGVADLVELPLIKYLDLEGNGITDMGVCCISQMPLIQELIISFNPITDCSIDNIRAMKRLLRLRIQNTNISRNGYERLKAERPDVVIERYELSYKMN